MKLLSVTLISLILSASAFAQANPEPVSKCRCDADWDATQHLTLGYKLVRTDSGKVVGYFPFDGMQYADDECFAASSPETLAEVCY